MSKVFKNKCIELCLGKCNFGITYEVGSYFSKWHQLHIALGFGQAFIKIPIDSGRDECDNPQYGFMFHNNSFWIYRGLNKNWYFDLPWFSYNWVRTSYLQRNEIDWVHDTPKDRQDWDFYNSKYIWSETHPYTYTLNNGTVQERIATIKVCEREWRRKWFGWSKLFSKTSKTIEIDFSDEVGERSGSWKGGTIGCSYNLVGNETPLECLRRMEKERKF